MEVSWNDAIAFVDWLNHKENGHRYRLPTEAEWEYACRAVDNPNGPWTPFNTGATISTDLANYDGSYTYGAGVKGIYRKKTTPCGSLPANKFGLYDMHGNAWQWCYDVYGDHIPPALCHRSAQGPNKQDPAASRVLRGGSLGRASSEVPFRIPQRGYAPGVRGSNFGFRVVLDSP